MKKEAAGPMYFHGGGSIPIHSISHRRFNSCFQLLVSAPVSRHFKQWDSISFCYPFLLKTTRPPNNRSQIYVVQHRLAPGFPHPILLGKYDAIVS
jgi:hypothetical protein